MLRLIRRRRAFGRLFFAHSISRAGDAFNTVALVVLVFRLTGSGVGVAATVAFEVAPVLLFGPVAGLLADRLSRRRVLVAADLVRAVLAGLLAVAHGSLVVAFFVAFGLSAGSVAFNPAVSAVVPDLVDDDELVDANSALWTVAVVAQIVLAPVAGLVIATLGVGAAFGINAVSFGASALILTRLRTAGVPAAASEHGWRGVAAGWIAVRRDRLLGRLAVVQVLAAFSAGATSGLLVVLASERLHVGASGFGLLLAAIGVGAALGPTLLRRFIRPGQRGWLFGPYALRGGVDLALATTTSPWIAGGALGLYGVGTSTGMVAYQSTVQASVPAETRGRTFALFDILWQATRLVSLAAGGIIADTLGIQAVYVLGGALLLIACAVGFVGLPATRRPTAT
jgi:MFS family permease